MECTICYNIYDSTRFIPMVGTCGHSVCKECVSQLENGKCPLCADVTMRTPSRNYLAIELLAEIDSKKKEQEEQLIGFNKQFSLIHKGFQQLRMTGSNIVPYGASNLFSPPSPPPQDVNGNNGTTVDQFSIYINHIGGWSQEDVSNHFKPFGTIERCGFGGSKNRGFALVTYEHAVSAQNAVKAMNNAPIGQHGQPIQVELKTVKSHNAQAVSDFAQRRHTMQISPKIVVKNLPDVTEDQVRRAFEADGKIVQVGLQNINGVFNGRAFVYFDNMMGVTQALKRNGTYFPQTTMKMKIEPYKAAY